jgi:hypothetical protein
MKKQNKNKNKKTNKNRQGQRSKRKTLEGGRGQSVMTDGPSDNISMRLFSWIWIKTHKYDWTISVKSFSIWLLNIQMFSITNSILKTESSWRFGETGPDRVYK